MKDELLDDLSDLDALKVLIPKQISVGFWKRFWATFLDFLFLAIVLNFGGAAMDAFYLIGHMSLAKDIGSVVGVIIALLYYPIFESSKYQASIGKQVLSLKVVDEEGKRLSFLHALGRFLAKWIAAILGLIGFLMIAFTDKRGMHDIIANTYVVKNKKE